MYEWASGDLFTTMMWTVPPLIVCAAKSKLPLAPRTYRFYAEFNDARAAAREDIVLYEAPDTQSSPLAELEARERAKFVRWQIIPFGPRPWNRKARDY